MKYIIIILILLSKTVFSQNEGTPIAGAVMASHAAENEELNKISKVQKEIALFQTAIAVAEADIYKVEKKIFDGLSKAEILIQDIKIVKRCSKQVIMINNYVKESLKLAKDNPKILIELKKAQLDFIVKTGYFINDTYIALKSSDLKLMNSKERYEILTIIFDNLKRLRFQASSLYNMTKYLVKNNLFDDIEKMVKNLKYNSDDMFSKYDNYFKDNLPKELKAE